MVQRHIERVISSLQPKGVVNDDSPPCATLSEQNALNRKRTAYRKDVQRSPAGSLIGGMVEVPTIDHLADPEAGCCRQECDGILETSAGPVPSSSRSALETLEVVLSIVIAVVAGILITRKFKDPLLGLIGLAIAFSIIEAFFAPALALTSIGLAVLAFLIYVISKTEMVALTPQSRKEILKNRDRRSHTAVEVE